MTITQNCAWRKVDDAALIKATDLGTGNLVPSCWYHKVLSCGKPDLVAITILSELWYLYRKNNGAEFDLGYIHFEKKFNLTRAQLQEATLRLHNTGLVVRSFRAVIVQGRKFPNELHLKLNLEAILALKPSKSSDNNNSGSSSGAQGDSFFDKVLGNSQVSSSEFSEQHNSNNKEFKKKNRSTEIGSNFSKDCFKEEGFRAREFGYFQEAKELKDFYPLMEADCLQLQRLSGRRFDLNSMNEILRSMSLRLKDKAFKTKKAFLSYMAKAFSHEIRSEEHINNINFKIIARGSEEERVARREQFLASIENSLQTSPEWHFKKRLTSVLSPDKAYEVLKAYIGVEVEDGICTLNLSKYVELSNTEKEIILAHAKSTHDGVVVDDEEKIFVETLKLDMPEKGKGNVTLSNNEYEPVFETNIWGDIRRGLVATFGGIIDKCWLSKVNAEVDEDDKRIKLTAPSSFIIHWVKDRYSEAIELLAQSFGVLKQLFVMKEVGQYETVCFLHKLTCGC